MAVPTHSLARLVASAFVFAAMSAQADTRIADSALPSYAKDQYPSWFQRHGAERMKEAERLAAAGAKQLVESGKCGKLDYIDLSDRSRPGAFVFFAECSNGRVYLAEADIEASRPVVSESERAWDETTAYMACREMILANVNYPNETDVHDVMGKRVRTIEHTHRVVVDLSFDAKNAFGVESAYQASCFFDPGATQGTIQIREL